MHHGRSAMEANASLLKRQVQPLKTNKIFFFFQNLLNNTCVKHNFKSVHVSNLF